MNGFVSLVGAGPGDPALLTRKAAARLHRADLVLYDALVDPRVLRLARRAQRFCVGKRAGRHSMTQEVINALMIRVARRGRRVVRLKGGDPLVFGRGGEEAIALNAAGVPFEIIPGITSAIAAPAAAGIPVTHRGIATAFLVVSGHDDYVLMDAASAVRPNGLTLVVLMGVARRSRIADRLIAHGWRSDTPTAVVLAASCERETAWRGRLVDLRDADVDSGDAGTIVVGDVASLDLRSVAGQLGIQGEQLPRPASEPQRRTRPSNARNSRGESRIPARESRESQIPNPKSRIISGRGGVAHVSCR